MALNTSSISSITSWFCMFSLCISLLICYELSITLIARVTLDVPWESRWIYYHNTRRILRAVDNYRSSPQSAQCSSVGPVMCVELYSHLIEHGGNRTVSVQPKYLRLAVLLSATRARWTDRCCRGQIRVALCALHRASPQLKWKAL